MRISFSLLACMAASAPCVLRAQPVPETQPVPTAAECEVWARELSFARSVAEHDAVAFAGHLHPGAVFGMKQARPTRGREAIAAEWKDIVSGRAFTLEWYPAMVAIGGEGDIAFSSGPALYVRTGERGKTMSIGAFQSVWHRGDDGIWRVLFDDGLRPQPATAEQAAAFRSARREACPRG